MKSLLRLFADGCDEGVKAQVLGVRDVSSTRVVRRIEHDGPLCFARGLEVSITFDETVFSGSGCFLLGVVLNEFFSNYVTINSFVETVINSIQRGVICRWQPTLQAGRALL